MKYNCIKILRKNIFKPIFCPILLSELNMGVDYIDNILNHENPLLSFFSLFSYKWTPLWYNLTTSIFGWPIAKLFQNRLRRQYNQIWEKSAHQKNLFKKFWLMSNFKKKNVQKNIFNRFILAVQKPFVNRRSLKYFLRARKIKVFDPKNHKLLIIEKKLSLYFGTCIFLTCNYWHWIIFSAKKRYLTLLLTQLTLHSAIQNVQKMMARFTSRITANAQERSH